MKFSLGETTTWTAKDAYERLKESLPKNWVLGHKVHEGWHQASILDDEGTQKWAGERADPKILFLDGLGWLSLQAHQVRNPVWRPRTQEVPLHRPPLKEEVPDPLDLDPSEVESVYKTSR